MKESRIIILAHKLKHNRIFNFSLLQHITRRQTFRSKGHVTLVFNMTPSTETNTHKEEYFSNLKNTRSRKLLTEQNRLYSVHSLQDLSRSLGEQTI